MERLRNLLEVELGFRLNSLTSESTLLTSILRPENALAIFDSSVC